MKKLFFILVLLSITMSGCKSRNEFTEKDKVDFLAQVETNSNNEVDISLQLISPASDMEADPDFDANMKLYNEDNELRAEANMPERPFMKKGELYQIFTWRGQLDPGKHQLNWSSEEFSGIKVSFEVVENPSGQISIEELFIQNNPVN